MFVKRKHAEDSKPANTVLSLPRVAGLSTSLHLFMTWRSKTYPLSPGFMEILVVML
jgi:hypothetical protein